MLFLTAETGILSPLTYLFGLLMNTIYEGLKSIGIGNIGIAIIIFTFITRIIMHPLTYNQQKSSKLMQVVQPEIQVIQKKYKGKTDQASMMAQQAEIKAVYEKYGTSMTGSCGQLLIQMPIIFALYRVIMNIPAYVNDIRAHFMTMVDAMGGVNCVDTLRDYISEGGKSLENATRFINNFEGATDEATKNYIIDFLYKLNPNQMQELASKFDANTQQIITSNMQVINEANSFLGLNLATAPNAFGLTLNPYLLVPVFAFLSQYISVTLMQKLNPQPAMQGDDENNQMAQTMKTMNVTMPIMSAVFCYGFATGIGVYWIASSLFMLLGQFIVSRQLKNVDIDELIRKNVEKQNIKRAKKGLQPLSAEKLSDTLKRIEEKEKEIEDNRAKVVEAQSEKSKEANDFYFGNEENPDSLFAKANMVAKYNEKHNK